jgi:hypothetical protein
MIPLLTYPLALITALTLPALAAIYFFRNRFKRHKVAGLFLWQHALQSREGGTVIRRMRTSPLFILELLALAALVIAACDPVRLRSSAKRSIIVILDNSASMLAGKQNRTSRDKALPAIRKFVRSGQFKSVRFVVAGEHPSLPDITDGNHWSDSALLNSWTCCDPSANLQTATALAAELGSRDSQLLLISDHLPPPELQQGRLQWMTFGTPLANIGFINARRSFCNGRDRIFVAVGNYSANAVKLTIPVVCDGRLIKKIKLKIKRGGNESAIMTLPPDCGNITMQLPQDALAIDNSITLLPQAPRKIRVRIDVADENLDRDITAAVDAAGLQRQRGATQLIITDNTNIQQTAASAWVMKISAPAKAVAYRGPFVVDYNHPLTEGLDFNGIIWGASATNSMQGTPLILAGNTPLLCEQILNSDKHIFYMQLAPKLSNLRSTPVWPALIWNICKLRSDALPGAKQRNYTSGTTANIMLPRNINELTLIHNESQPRRLTPHKNSASVSLPLPGIYTISDGNFKTSLAANFASAAESDLRRCSTASQGSANNSETLIRDYRSLAWIAALAALLLLTLHTILIAKQTHNKEVVI